MWRVQETAQGLEEDACLVIRKVLEELRVMWSRYKPPSKKLPHPENDNNIQLATGFKPGHVMVSGELEHHRQLYAWGFKPDKACLALQKLSLDTPPATATSLGRLAHVFTLFLPSLHVFVV
ncbi:hypothetical protein DSO57_1009101 [Entomophthora muscae]|uniref:Uncharacterized protein n=1 Tax=Entomophthora muscae TaxID=34485 RepID=A0ACC2RY20_9FUNG|nr:hypothetical protein DSO57_1009101 [Entomophthora muscae]